MLTGLVVAITLPLLACGDDDSDAVTTPPTDRAVDVAIEGFLFRDDAVDVALGTTVTWSNADDFAHTVTADDDSFDSSDIGPGASFEQRFDDPGTFSYFCAIHNYMKGTITVA